ncbi:hypothetical protein CAPTEDRAFT_155355 [Capitella teleta]|uniref:Cleavage and polyadenylation specificity factor subunit 2 n=1 Tax=Capitella teleta TaxID=283909 RepID=R7V1Z3_CAPTE|nr:hypothetical protein CAPTEDRAFT_155355 [Capitella teleta]|eukprot:ELU12868.1 hypothetical protein CAPTEDRAFT_155355 [Capitella teleta]
MTSIIKLQPFSGVDGESPPCYMLQVDEFHFLLDCGWDEEFDPVFMENLKKHLPQIDAVLLSYPDPQHLGALPYLVGKCGMTCPIYSTLPVYKMGQMFMYDLYQSHHNSEEFNLFSLDDVDAAFDRIQQLKYSQTINLKGKGHGLQITPLPAGHMIGGTIWKIVKDGEEEIIYAVDYNHKRERHLNGCVLETINRPHLLITDAYNADFNQARRRLRDEQLMTTILQTLRNDGNCLVALDTAGRILELAHLLDQMWRNQESGLMAYSLALLNNVAYNVVEFAKSQVEWMSDKIMRSFEERRNNPFQFKHLQLCHSMAELAKVPEPKVVLASTPDLQTGFSRELFVQWCSNPKNCIILTNRTAPPTLCRQLIDYPNRGSVRLEVKRRVRLEGRALEDFLRAERERKAEVEREKAEKERREREGLESSDDSADEEVGDGGRHDLMVKMEKGKGFFKQVKKSQAMFPFEEEKLKWDEYGEIIRIEDYIIKEATTMEDEPMHNELKSFVTEKTEVPTKCISSSETLELRANILYIDFEGRSDGDSMRKIISQVRPRQLILVRGSRESTESLAAFCRDAPDIGKVYTPRLNELVDATTESKIFQVRLKDSVVSALNFSKARDAEIAWIDAMLDLNQAEAMEDGENPEDEEAVPVVIPTSQIRPHGAVFVNEPKLSDFKQTLVNLGVQAEFSAGVLICNSVVAVRKNEAGRLQLEGTLCDDYYRIRQLLYEQFAIV